MLHEAWDSGRCDAVFTDMLGVGILPYIAAKTVKTRCGKRVAASKIDNGRANCSACVVELERERIAGERLEEYMRLQNTLGQDAANAYVETWKDRS